MARRRWGRRLALAGTVAGTIITLAVMASAINYGTVSAGTSVDLDNKRAIYNTALPPGKAVTDIVGVAITGDPSKGDQIFLTFFKDGTFAKGVSNRLDKWGTGTYTLPAGKAPHNIVGIAAGKQHIFAFYNNGQVSGGYVLPAFGPNKKVNFESYRKLYSYTVPVGVQPHNIVGVAIDASNNWVFAWYNNGKVSAGTTDQLGSRRPLQAFTAAPGKSPFSIVGVGIASDKKWSFPIYK